MGTTKEETGKGKGGGEGRDSSLQPGNEPNTTHNRTKLGIGRILPFHIKLHWDITRRKWRPSHKYKSKPPYELETNVSKGQESKKRSPETRLD